MLEQENWEDQKRWLWNNENIKKILQDLKASQYPSTDHNLDNHIRDQGVGHREKDTSQDLQVADKKVKFSSGYDI